jgi:glutamate synthase (NADPH) small chain
LGVADAGGRHVAQPLPGSHFELEADLVIMALGFDADDMPALFDAPELAVAPAGTIRIDRRTMVTSLDGVFAAGDIVRGASLVVWAIRDGRDAAEQMHGYVQQKAMALAVAAE